MRNGTLAMRTQETDVNAAQVERSAGKGAPVEEHERVAEAPRRRAHAHSCMFLCSSTRSAERELEVLCDCLDIRALAPSDKRVCSKLSVGGGIEARLALRRRTTCGLLLLLLLLLHGLIVLLMLYATRISRQLCIAAVRRSGGGSSRRCGG